MPTCTPDGRGMRSPTSAFGSTGAPSASAASNAAEATHWRGLGANAGQVPTRRAQIDGASGELALTPDGEATSRSGTGRTGQGSRGVGRVQRRSARGRPGHGRAAPPDQGMSRWQLASNSSRQGVPTAPGAAADSCAHPTGPDEGVAMNAWQPPCRPRWTTGLTQR